MPHLRSPRAAILLSSLSAALLALGGAPSAAHAQGFLERMSRAAQEAAVEAAKRRAERAARAGAERGVDAATDAATRQLARALAERAPQADSAAADSVASDGVDADSAAGDGVEADSTASDADGAGDAGRGGVLPTADAEALYHALADSGRVATPGLRFAAGSVALRPESAPTLREVAAMLARHPELRVVVEAHTGDAGDAAVDQALAEARAAAVVAALVRTYAVDATRLEARGHGAVGPATPTTTERRPAAGGIGLVRR